jgi:hypothetical protein
LSQLTIWTGAANIIFAHIGDAERMNKVQNLEDQTIRATINIAGLRAQTRNR